LHHNIDYDTEAFFAHKVQPSTPASTLRSGLAVCEGYAALFTALATPAGLESVVIGGHGKGYGHTPLRPGAPIPPYSAGHAWNAVRIDNGEWKLIDCCWGAGNVQGAGMPYERNFKPQFFTMDNDEFGASHFPEDRARFHRLDGRPGVSWEEYMLDDVGERVLVYGPATPEHGIGERTFQPALKHIGVHDPAGGPVVRFQFAAVCPHWDNERHGRGKPYVMVLHVEGRDGREPDNVPFQTDGRVWWLDVQRVELGAPGQKVTAFAVTSFDGRDGRAVGIEEFKRRKGRVAMGFGGVAMWELV
jgi:Transglutaminase-like superfamily